MKEGLIIRYDEKLLPERMPPDIAFVREAIREVAEPISRYGIDPDSVPSQPLSTKQLIGEYTIATGLRNMRYLDPHFDNLDLSSPQGISDGAVLSYAKAEVLKSVSTNPEERLAAQRFQDRVLEGAGRAIARVGGRKAVVAASALALISTACGQAVTPETLGIPTTVPRTADQNIQRGEGEFVVGDAALSQVLLGMQSGESGIEIPLEAITPFSLDVEGAKFDFVSLAPLENEEKQISWDEKLFMRVNDSLEELDRRVVNIDGQELVLWSYLGGGDPEPVLWYPSLTREQWESLSPESRKGFYAGFAPPTPLEGKIPGFVRSSDGMYAISFDGLSETAFKTMAAINPIFDAEAAAPVVDSEIKNILEEKGLEVADNGQVSMKNPEGIFEAIPGVTVTDLGVEVVMAQKKYLVSKENLDKGVRVKDGMFSFFPELTKNAPAVFDKGTWVRADQIIETDPSKPESIVRVSTEEDLDHIFDLEAMVVGEFPEGTWFPDLEKVVVDYSYAEPGAEYDPDPTLSRTYPLGSRTDLTNLPLTPCNLIILEANSEEGRSKDTVILSEKVFNPNGKPPAVLHFGSNTGYNYPTFESVLADTALDMDQSWGLILLPEYLLDGKVFLNSGFSGDNNLIFLSRKGYWKNGDLVGIDILVKEWLTSGNVPDELTRLLLIRERRHFLPPELR